MASNLPDKWPRKSRPSTFGWQNLKGRDIDNGERWAIFWDTRRKPGSAERNRAEEKSEHAALDRARHLLRMSFVVYEICGPTGEVLLDEAGLRQRLGLDPVAA